MTRDRATCVHETAVLDVTMSGGWPADADAALVRHASRCPVCRDLVTVVTALAADDDSGMAEDHRLPDASVLWHRAHERARQDAARRATEPVLFAQIGAAAIGLLLLLVWAGGAIEAVAQKAADWGGTAVTALRDTATELPLPSFEPGDAVNRVMTDRRLIAGLGTSTVLLLAAYGISRLADRIREP